MNLKIIMTATAAALLLIVFALATQRDAEAAKETKKSDVKKLMLAAHKAPKGSPQGTKSPLEIVQAQLKSDEPKWDLIATNTKPLAVLAEAIEGKRFGYRGPPKPYVDGVALLQVAAKNHDLAKGRLAMQGIARSCANCHRP